LTDAEQERERRNHEVYILLQRKPREDEAQRKIIRAEETGKVTSWENSPREYHRGTNSRPVCRIALSEMPKRDRYTMNGLEFKVEKERDATFWKGPNGEEYESDVPLYGNRYPLKDKGPAYKDKRNVNSPGR
jgi:hypothetical protein